MLLSLFTIADFLLQVLIWIIVIQAILSWLVAFNVINTHNDFVRSFLHALDRITRAALPADPQDPARFRRPRFLADRRPAADLRAPHPARRVAVARSPCAAQALDERRDHRRQGFAEGLRARVAAAIPAFVAQPGRAARPGRRPGRRRSGEPDLCPRQGQGDGRGRAWRASRTASPTRPARTSCSPWSRRLNADEAVDGILVQLPLPAQIDETKR